MARNLSWIDPEKLASLLDVVSPAPRRVAGEDPSEEGTIDSALFAATYTPESPREPAATKTGNRTPAPTPTPAPMGNRAPAAPATRADAAEPAPRRAVAPTPAPVTPARPAPAPAAVAPAETAAPALATAVTEAAPSPRLQALVAFQPDPRADLSVRLEAFLDWVVSTTRSRGALITDANGLVVVERRANEIEACMTASVDLMLNHVADVVHSDLDGYVTFHRNGLHLVTLWTPSEYGRFFGVLIGETAPPQESIALAGQGFRTLFAN
jgi:hypothetical protein